MKIKANKQHLRERMNDALAGKRFRAECLARRIARNPEITAEPVLLEGIAVELRALAYQIRALQLARLAIDNG